MHSSKPLMSHGVLHVYVLNIGVNHGKAVTTYLTSGINPCTRKTQQGPMEQLMKEHEIQQLQRVQKSPQGKLLKCKIKLKRKTKELRHFKTS
jgi:hypothetical protein